VTLKSAITLLRELVAQRVVSFHRDSQFVANVHVEFRQKIQILESGRACV
jgi:O-succinylbenzoate synthase